MLAMLPSSVRFSINTSLVYSLVRSGNSDEHVGLPVNHRFLRRPSLSLNRLPDLATSVRALAEVLVVRRLDADAFAVDPWLAWSGATVVVLAVVCLAAISIGALRTGRTGHVGP